MGRWVGTLLVAYWTNPTPWTEKHAEWTSSGTCILRLLAPAKSSAPLESAVTSCLPEAIISARDWQLQSCLKTIKYCGLLAVLSQDTRYQLEWMKFFWNWNAGLTAILFFFFDTIISRSDFRWCQTPLGFSGLYPSRPWTKSIVKSCDTSSDEILADRS